MAEKWASLNQEEEALHRQRLFRKARKGDEKAKQELQEHLQRAGVVREGTGQVRLYHSRTQGQTRETARLESLDLQPCKPCLHKRAPRPS